MTGKSGNIILVFYLMLYPGCWWQTQHEWELAKFENVAKVELTGSKTCQCGQGTNQEDITATGANAIATAETECKDKGKEIQACGPAE